MAPRKRRAEVEVNVQVAVKETATASVRVTRSAARKANSPSVVVPEHKPSHANKKKAKVSRKEQEEDENVENEQKAEDKDGNGETETLSEAEVGDEAEERAEKMMTTIIIEHCKQCNSFKSRAAQVKEGLETAILGIIVKVNPEKPRRGCFEIREEGGEKFISLLNMKRPFGPMKALDMVKVISDIVDKIK